jgi:hypothetical protein
MPPIMDVEKLPNPPSIKIIPIVHGFDKNLLKPIKFDLEFSFVIIS